MRQPAPSLKYCNCWALQPNPNTEHIVHQHSCPKHPLHHIKQEHHKAFGQFSKTWAHRCPCSSNCGWCTATHTTTAAPSFLDYLECQQSALNAAHLALQRKIEEMGLLVFLGAACHQSCAYEFVGALEDNAIDRLERRRWSTATLTEDMEAAPAHGAAKMRSAPISSKKAEKKLGRLCKEMGRVMDQMDAVKEMIAEEKGASAPVF